VKFRYKEHFEGNFEYGFVAEEVAEVYPDAVVYSPSGQAEAVQYHKINAMLLNEFQKQQKEIQELKARLAEMESLLQSQARSGSVGVPNQ
jgi:DNA gyrase/topoisomerase IV subunit A